MFNGCCCSTQMNIIHTHTPKHAHWNIVLSIEKSRRKKNTRESPLVCSTFVVYCSPFHCSPCNGLVESLKRMYVIVASAVAANFDADDSVYTYIYNIVYFLMEIHLRYYGCCLSFSFLLSSPHNNFFLLHF